MLPRHALIAAALVAPLVASCVGQEIPPQQTAKGEARLAQRLAGLVAGAPVNCLPRFRSNDMEVIDDDTILFHDGRTIYRQDTGGNCYPRGSSAGYALVTRSVGGSSGFCAGDIAQVVDTSGGFFVGSCSFNPFIPYRRP